MKSYGSDLSNISEKDVKRNRGWLIVLVVLTVINSIAMVAHVMKVF